MSTVKFEMHFHTEESSPCGKIPAKTGVELYEKAGYDGIVITDHFSKSVLGGPEKQSWEETFKKFLKGYKEAKQFAANRNIQVLLGMEIRFPDNENDFLVYGIDEAFLEKYPWIYMKDLSYLHEIAEKENLVIVQAHPFRGNCYLAPTNYLHGIEVYNGNPRHDSRNELAKEAANLYGLLQTTGSDFHREGDLSGTYFELSDMPKTEKELAAMLKVFP